MEYCNAGDSGPVVGQVAQIVLSPSLATVGESLNYGQIGQSLSATAEDCKGNSVSVSSFTYASTSSFTSSATSSNIFADINPTTGQVCGGTWNRNTGGGVADYTTCTPPSETPISSSTPVSLNITQPTQTAQSISTLTIGTSSDFVSGYLTLSLANGTPHSITVASDTTLTALAAQINSDPVFSAEGITASFNFDTNPLVLTITGPAGSANTVGTAGRQATSTAAAIPGTSLIDSSTGYLAYVTATANGAVSNAIPIYVHPTVTGVVLGGATPGASNGSCPADTPDPGTDCCPLTTTGTAQTAPVYSGTGCLSQNQTGQLVARIYAGGNTLPINNVTCHVGHLTYGTQNASNVVTINDTGLATAVQPGSTEITATIAQSSTATNAGFFSTCPPASIQLSANGATSATISLNNTLPLSATVLDTNGLPITGLSLEYNSTSPQTITAGGAVVTPSYPGTADITAVCQPSTCNPSGFSQIGINGGGKPITSNPVTVTANGQSSTVIYAASLGTSTSTGTTTGGSQYLFTRDFTTSQPGSLIKLPYVPNSMVITQSGASIFMGSSGGLMMVTTSNNSVGTAQQTIAGSVLAVSPDGSTVVVTDPIRQTISLVSTSSNSITTSYGGVGTRAVWSPDSQTVYVTTNAGQILSYSQFTNWESASSPVYNDVAIAVPSVGAYFAGPNSTDGRSYCSSTTSTTAGNPPTATNSFLPLADQDTSAIVDRLIATNDGLHILGAHVPTTGAATFTDFDLKNQSGPGLPTAACPTVISPGYFISTPFTEPFTTSGTNPVTITATQITGIVPSSNSAVAFVTYNGTSGLLPYYIVPAQGSFGKLAYVTLSSGTAPLAGAFSIDNSTFYVGTATDDLIHEITVTYPSGGTPTATDSGTLTPQLPAATGSGYAPVNSIVQHPKKATS